MSHTSGPWKAICDDPISPSRMAIVATGWAGGQAIDATKSGKDFAEDCANARLIAAAPDLLAALRDCALIVNGMWNKTLPPCFAPNLELVNSVNRAIAKAERPL